MYRPSSICQDRSQSARSRSAAARRSSMQGQPRLIQASSLGSFASRSHQAACGRLHRRRRGHRRRLDRARPLSARLCDRGTRQLHHRLAVLRLPHALRHIRTARAAAPRRQLLPPPPYVVVEALLALAVERHAETSWFGVGPAVGSLLICPASASPSAASEGGSAVTLKQLRGDSARAVF